MVLQTSKAACKEGTMLVICSTTDLKLRPKGLSILTGYTLGGTGGKFRSPLPDLFHSLSEKGFHGSVRQSALHALYNNHSQHCRTCLACQRLGMWNVDGDSPLERSRGDNWNGNWFKA